MLNSSYQLISLDFIQVKPLGRISYVRGLQKFCLHKNPIFLIKSCQTIYSPPADKLRNIRRETGHWQFNSNIFRRRIFCFTKGSLFLIFLLKKFHKTVTPPPRGFMKVFSSVFLYYCKQKYHQRRKHLLAWFTLLTLQTHKCGHNL